MKVAGAQDYGHDEEEADSCVERGANYAKEESLAERTAKG